MRRPAIATVILGPSPLFREGLSRILSEADFRVVASAPSVDDFVLSSVPQHPAILLIIDAADNLSAAVRQVAIFKDRRPTGRIAVLADHNQPDDIVSAFRAGANAYFTKVAPSDALIKYLELVMLGETILPAAILSSVLDRTEDEAEDAQEVMPAPSDLDNIADHRFDADSDHMPMLSERERSILKCLIAGDSNKIIARRIEIAEATVKVHIKAILRKIRVQNRTQAAIWAMSNGNLITALGNGGHPPAKAALGPAATPQTLRAIPAGSRNGGGG